MKKSYVHDQRSGCTSGEHDVALMCHQTLLPKLSFMSNSIHKQAAFGLAEARSEHHHHHLPDCVSLSRNKDVESDGGTSQCDILPRAPALIPGPAAARSHFTKRHSSPRTLTLTNLNRPVPQEMCAKTSSQRKSAAFRRSGKALWRAAGQQLQPVTATVTSTKNFSKLVAALPGQSGQKEKIISENCTFGSSFLVV